MTTFNQASRDEIIQKWIDAQTDLAAAKELEMQLRKQVTELCFPDPLAARTQNLELGKGYVLKLESTVTHKLDKANVDSVLSKIEKQFEEGKFIAARLVKFDPILSVSEYNKLDAKVKKIFDAVVTITPAAPKLTFIEPKVKD
jgi:hypothetical protein